jgi:hypothetical protein
VAYADGGASMIGCDDCNCWYHWYVKFLFHSFFNDNILISQVLRRDPNGTPGKRVVLSGLYAGAKRPIQKDKGEKKT